MEVGLALQEYLEFVIGRLVEQTERASVVHHEDGKSHVYQVTVSPDDMGRVIGRNGYTISSIRSLFEAAAKKHKVKAVLKVDEGV